MTDGERKAAKATMPWTEHSVQRGRQVIIQVLDNHGLEVPIFTMTKFLTLITHKLAHAPMKRGKMRDSRKLTRREEQMGECEMYMVY